MEPQYLLIQQIQTTAQMIEESLQYVYDPEVPPEQKRLALNYMFVQARQIDELLKGLFTQLQHLDRGM